MSLLALTLGLTSSLGYDAQYSEVGEDYHHKRNEVHCDDTEQIVGHFLSWRREETECYTLVEIRNVRVLFYMEHHTLKK